MNSQLVHQTCTNCGYFGCIGVYIRPECKWAADVCCYCCHLFAVQAYAYFQSMDRHICHVQKKHQTYFFFSGKNRSLKIHLLVFSARKNYAWRFLSACHVRLLMVRSVCKAFARSSFQRPLCNFIRKINERESPGYRPFPTKLSKR